MDFVGKRNFFFIFSGVLLLAGLVSLLLPGGLNRGIEFSSGTIMTLSFRQPVAVGDLRGKLSAQGLDVIVQHAPKAGYLLAPLPAQEGVPPPAPKEQLQVVLGERFGGVRLLDFDAGGLVAVFAGDVKGEPLAQAVAALGYKEQALKVDEFLVRTESLSEARLGQLGAALARDLGPMDSYNVYSVSPIMAVEKVQYSLYAVLAAAVGILLYIAFAFRQVPNPFRYGVCALVALAHDVLIAVGVYSILGRFFNLEVNIMFIAAVLTVLGFSVHDTIVVFDRLRENQARYPNQPFSQLVNRSIVETLGRSINTSLTLVFTMVALLLFGGVTIAGFVLVLLVGVVIGTYSSICIAAQLLVVWRERGQQKPSIATRQAATR